MFEAAELRWSAFIRAVTRVCELRPPTSQRRAALCPARFTVVMCDMSCRAAQALRCTKPSSRSGSRASAVVVLLAGVSLRSGRRVLASGHRWWSAVLRLGGMAALQVPLASFIWCALF